MPDRLAGRVALVTGAGRGIGRAHAIALAGLGATVVVNDAGGAVDGVTAGTENGAVENGAVEDGAVGAAGGGDPAAEVVAEIERIGGRAVADRTSIGPWAAAEQLVGSTLDRFGRLDIVVNNAGILRPRTVVGIGAAEWSDVLRVHLDGTLTLAHFAARHWRARAKAGDPLPARLVNTTSPAGLFGGGQVNYAAAKAAVVAVTQIAAGELAPYGVTVNAIAPVALTRMSEGMALSIHAAEHPAALVAWLCSDAAAEVTGQVFVVGGGHVSVVRRPQAGPGADTDGRWTVDDLDDVVPRLLDDAGPHPDLFGYLPGRDRPAAFADIGVTDPRQS